MPIRIYLSEPDSFDQVTIDAMSRAFEYSCLAAPDADRETLARRIIELAKGGERNPVTLSAQVVSELPR